MSSTIPIRGTSLRNLNLLLQTAPRFVKSQFRLHTTASTQSSSSSLSSSSSSSSSSVNPIEVSHFNALASTWWDPHGSSRLLHLMNPLRHDFIKACHATQPTPMAKEGLRYLDIGCGGGIFAESAARMGSTGSVLGIDPTPEVLAVARKHARQDPALKEKLEYRNMPIEGLPKPKSLSQQYDILSLFEVIEHITHPAAFLDVCKDHVKPGGWLIMSTIARTWTSWFTTKLIAEDVVGIVPPGTHDWNKYINEEELRGYFLGEKGWNSPQAMGVIYVPGVGWKSVPRSEKVGNYFFGIRRDE